MPSGITDSGKYFNWVIWMNNKLQDHNFLSQNQIEKWRCKSIVSLNLKVWMQSKNYSHCLSFAILPWFLAQFKSLRKNKTIQNISKISNPICFIRLVLISKETLKNRNTKKWFWNYMPFNSCYHTIFMFQTFFENESEKYIYLLTFEYRQLAKGEHGKEIPHAFCKNDFLVLCWK